MLIFLQIGSLDIGLYIIIVIKVSLNLNLNLNYFYSKIISIIIFFLKKWITKSCSMPENHQQPTGVSPLTEIYIYLQINSLDIGLHIVFFSQIFYFVIVKDPEKDQQQTGKSITEKQAMFYAFDFFFK